MQSMIERTNTWIQIWTSGISSGRGPMYDGGGGGIEREGWDEKGLLYKAYNACVALVDGRRCTELIIED